MFERAVRVWDLRLLSGWASSLRVRELIVSQVDPTSLRYVASMQAWLHWVLIVLMMFILLYRPIYEHWSPQFVVYLVFLVGLVAFNGYFHYRVLSNREITWRSVFIFSALEVALLSVAVAISGGFEHFYLYLLYYPPLVFCAAVITSLMLNLVLVTMVAAIYAGLSLAVGAGMDLHMGDARALLVTIFVMYVVVVLVSLIARFERRRWRLAIERERVLLRERTELSQAIHNTMAQSAYMIGLGIDRAKNLADKSNKELMTALEETSGLSRSAMWDLRQPIEIGEIFDGMALGDVLESLVATFSTISSVPTEFVQSGVEPALPTATRGALFCIAHNALTNAMRHSNARHVYVNLSFEKADLRLSVSDDGVCLPDDYATRGRGFRNMREDADRAGGKLKVESGVASGGTTVTCIAPYNSTESALQSHGRCLNGF